MRPTQERPLARDGAGRRGLRRPAFTLVELLVVIAIIGLLIAILIPSLRGAKNAAKATASQSKMAGLETGLEMYKQESALGGAYPPSKSDWGDPTNPDDARVTDPMPLLDGSPSMGQELTHTTGASLLVYALNGADGLGTPGFRDLNGDQRWSDDFGMNDTIDPPQAHAIDELTAEPITPRYGPFADSDPLRRSIKSIGELVESGVLREPDSADAWGTTCDQDDYKHKVFTDEWGLPILYYRARRAARAIVPTENPAMPGVFDPYDNIAITGRTDQLHGLISGYYCLYPTKGGLQSGKGHPLGYFRALLEPTDPVGYLDPQASNYESDYAGSFEQYVWDSTVSVRPTPVRKDSFLLISAGADGLYGTGDDVTNFQRN